MDESLGPEYQSLFQTVGDAFQLQYQGHSLIKINIINPLSELVDYIYKAHEADLDKRNQCSYAGSVLVFSTLKEMNLKYSSDVDKVNSVYLAGMKLANTIWDKLDELEQTLPKISNHTLDNMKNQLYEMIWQCTIK